MKTGSAYSEIRTKITELTEKLNFSQNQLAQKIGISSSVISQILEGKYEYNPDNYVWIQIIKFLEKFDNKIYETKLLRVGYRMLNQAFKEKEIAVITSCSGAGKTTMVEQYCLINPFAVHIRVNEVFRPKYLLQKMMQSVGAEYLGMSMQQMYESLSDILTRRERLFVIDEAERLDVCELELLRDIYDQGNIGLVLIGLENLRTLLKRGKSMRENLVQLYSRVAYQRVVDILEAGDVRMVFNDKFPKNEISDRMYSELSRKYEKQGGLRAIIKLANLTEKAAEKNNIRKINDELVADCSKELFI